MSEDKALPELIVTRGDGIPLPDQKAALREFMARCEKPQVDPFKGLFPGTASMFSSARHMAVTEEWMRGWNACLDEIDRRGGFSHSAEVPRGPV